MVGFQRARLLDRLSSYVYMYVFFTTLDVYEWYSPLAPMAVLRGLWGVRTPRAGFIYLVAEILYKQGKFQTPCSSCLCLVFVQR